MQTHSKIQIKKKRSQNWVMTGVGISQPSNALVIALLKSSRIFSWTGCIGLCLMVTGFPIYIKKCFIAITNLTITRSEGDNEGRGAGGLSPPIVAQFSSFWSMS